MKTIIRISLLLLLLVSEDGIACTSFSVCTGENKVLYGMNFDYYPNSRLCFLIQPWMEKKLFHMACDCYKGYTGKNTVGMNTEGLFANMQLLYPSDNSGWKEGPNTSFFWEIYQESLQSFGSVKDVRVLLNERRLIQGVGVTRHSTFADKHGDLCLPIPNNLAW
jgi:penicillin V acylase-like amidase (Ntn superfamily)